MDFTGGAVKSIKKVKVKMKKEETESDIQRAAGTECHALPHPVILPKSVSMPPCLRGESDPSQTDLTLFNLKNKNQTPIYLDYQATIRWDSQPSTRPTLNF